MNITLTITDDEQKVLESWLGVGGIETWLQNALLNKIRQRTDASILEHTVFNPKKMTIEDKLVELSKIELLTKEERE